MSQENKKETWKLIINMVISILTRHRNDLRYDQLHGLLKSTVLNKMLQAQADNNIKREE